MLNRWIGISLGALMLLANGVVVFRDVIPNFLVGDPPKSIGATISKGHQEFIQVGMFDPSDRLLGRSWTDCQRTSDTVHVLSITLLEPFYLPNGINTPRVRIVTQLTYHMPDARVDTLEFAVFGLQGMNVSLKGEQMPSGEFPCIWTIGSDSGRFIIPSELTRAIGDVVKPFDRLPDLYVGRSWEVKLLNPIALLAPSLRSGDQFDMQTIVVQCTGKEVISWGGEQVDVFVVESPGVRACVDHDGRVLRQELNLPLLGRMILKDEAYDPLLRDAANKSVPTNR